MAMRAVAVMPGRIRLSGSFSTSPRSKFFCGGHPELKSTFASTEIRSTEAAKSLPGTASILTVAGCPTFKRPRSDSSSRASRWIDDRSGSSTMLAPGPGAVPLVELHFAAKHAAGPIVRHDADGAGGRRLDLQRCETALGHARDRTCAFARLRCLRHDVGFGRGLVRLGFRLGFAQLQLGIGDASLACSYSSFETEIALPEIELGAIEVVARLHHRRLILLLGDLLLRLDLGDLGVGLLQLGQLFLHALLQRGGIELDERRRRPSPRCRSWPASRSGDRRAWVGADSTIDLAGRISPRSCR